MSMRASNLSLMCCSEQSLFRVAVTSSVLSPRLCSHATCTRGKALQVVAGLDEALLSMQTGGVRRVYIPGPLAFPKGLPSGPGRCAEVSGC